MSVWAVVPAYNEEERIAETVKALLTGANCQTVIVVDDGSRDQTAKIAAGAGALVLRQPRNGGKGLALARGVGEAMAAQEKLSAVLLADADLGASAANLGPLVEAVRDGFDMAIASFASRGGFGVAKGIAARGIAALTGCTFESPLSGQRALSARALPLVLSVPPGWGVEVAMTVRALRQGFGVVEVPLELSHRETKRDLAGFLHRGRQCWGIVATLIALAREGAGKPREGWAG